MSINNKDNIEKIQNEISDDEGFTKKPINKRPPEQMDTLKKVLKVSCGITIFSLILIWAIVSIGKKFEVDKIVIIPNTLNDAQVNVFS